MPTRREAAHALAQRLRDLRLAHWPDVRITQEKLAFALGQRKPASVQLISSWERQTDPTTPPEDRIEAIATFFSTRRSLVGPWPRLLTEADLTADECEVREMLRRELLDLRRAALSDGSAGPGTVVGHGAWHLPGEAPIIIVCSELPPDGQPPSAAFDPDWSHLSRFGDLDSFVELYGHIRAVNPDADVRYRGAMNWRADEATGHLVVIGGIDLNTVTQDTMFHTRMPVRQYSDDLDPSRGYFGVIGEEEQRFAPTFRSAGSEHVLIEDVGCFMRAPNPLNRDFTVTMCNGMYGAGVLGAVRTLTKKEFRVRNTEYLNQTFPKADTFGLLFRVLIMDGVMATPDWTAPGTVLYSWAGGTA